MERGSQREVVTNKLSGKLGADQTDNTIRTFPSGGNAAVLAMNNQTPSHTTGPVRNEPRHKV